MANDPGLLASALERKTREVEILKRVALELNGTLDLAPLLQNSTRFPAPGPGVCAYTSSTCTDTT